MRLEVILNTGRTLDQGVNVENKLSAEYEKAAALCELNPEDMVMLGNPPAVTVTTEFGSVTVHAASSDRTPAGMVFMPYGPWANMLTDPDTCGCGMPGLKGIWASVEASAGEVMSLKKLLRGII